MNYSDFLKMKERVFILVKKKKKKYSGFDKSITDSSNVLKYQGRTSQNLNTFYTMRLKA